MKDPFPPSRIAGINAIAATQQFYTVAETGTRVLPTLAMVTIDPEKSVRDQGFRVVKGFLSKLEKVSDDPSLKEEMEKEVGSTNSAVVAAAAGWANWAVGAVTAKFYKSPAPTSSTPAQGDNKDKSASPPSKSESVTENVSKMNLGSSDSKANKSVNNISAGWDDGDDGWGDLNDAPGDENNTKDGWDDNEDWASLEDNKPAKTESTSNYDWGGGFNQGTKSHDPFADIKPPTDNLMAGPGGWDDWGDSAGGGHLEDVGKDEARRRREEKRAERQKELEAKRAAKKGPMKLGAKKMID